MRCELCTRKLGRTEIAHGIRYGTVEDTGVFLPSRDSAYTIICQSCSEMLLRVIYQKLNNPTNHQYYHYR